MLDAFTCILSLMRLTCRDSHQCNQESYFYSIEFQRLQLSREIQKRVSKAEQRVAALKGLLVEVPDEGIGFRVVEIRGCHQDAQLDARQTEYGELVGSCSG